MIDENRFLICRSSKEKVMYEKEVVDQTAKVEKMKEEKKDEHDIKKQVCCVTTLELLCATVKKLRIYAHKNSYFLSCVN